MSYLEGIITFAALLTGFLVQTIAGFAGGLISLPLLLLAFPIAESVAVISVFNFAFSAIQLSRGLKEIDTTIYRDLGATTVLGVSIGALVLSYGNPTILKRALGVFVLLYIGHRFLKKKKFTVTRLRAAVLGLVGGFFAGLFSSGAPPYVVYMMNRYTDHRQIRANIIGILAVTNTTRLIALILTGVLTFSLWENILWGTPAFLIALFLGEKTFERLNREVFLKVVIFFLAISGILLLVR